MSAVRTMERALVRAFRHPLTSAAYAVGLGRGLAEAVVQRVRGRAPYAAPAEPEVVLSEPGARLAAESDLPAPPAGEPAVPDELLDLDDDTDPGTMRREADTVLRDATRQQRPS